MDYSSFLSTINFCLRVETPLFTANRQSDAIQFYCRYHDDMFMALKCEAEAVRVLHQITDLVFGSYTLKLDSISTNGVSMLDLFIYKRSNVSDTRRLSYKPYIKPTARHVPLSETSEHPMHVHRSWPLSEIQRMFDLSERAVDFEEFRQKKLTRFEEFGMPACILNKCKEWRPASICESAMQNRDCVNIRNSGMIVRAIMPYHRSLAACLPSALKRASDRIQIILGRF